LREGDELWLLGADKLAGDDQFSGAVLVAYCLWAFEKAEAAVGSPTIPWYQLSILPFVMAVLRYALVLDKGDRGSAPEEIILGDRTLQLIGVAWAIVFGIGVYTA
jgi:decaprenyl-phosphate phosphoribosyltransferase